MKTAIISLTKQGYQQGLKVKQVFMENNPDGVVDFFAPARTYVDPAQAMVFQDLATTVHQVFTSYRRIIFIMALGIVVRMIANHIKDKTTDPAMVVMDEAGQYVISVLSGHLGGANSLARFIATAIDAKPVITTATDVHGLPAVDDLARELNLALDPVAAVKKVNSGVVNGKTIHIYSQEQLPVTPSPQVKIYGLDQYQAMADKAHFNVVVTNRIIEVVSDQTMFLRPRNLVAGIGCRAGTSANEILNAIEDALEKCGRSSMSLRALATIELKAKEQGLCQAASRLKLPLISFSVEEINNFISGTELKLQKSEFVQEKVGVPGVCEPAALIATGKGELIFPKQKYQGITVAIAEGL